MPRRIRRWFGCYDSDVDTWSPDFEPPVPDKYMQSYTWSSSRHRALERQLTDASGAVKVMSRDSAALVNVFCDRDLYMEGPAAASPFSNAAPAAPHAATFRRLTSIPNRASSAPLSHPADYNSRRHTTGSSRGGSYTQQPHWQQQQQYPPIQHCPPMQQYPQYPQPHCYQQQQQQQPSQLQPSPSVISAAAAAASGPHTLQWTQSRRILEANLVVEQAVTKLQEGPDYLSEQQRLEQRLSRLNLVVQVAAGDGNCQFRSVSEQLYGTQDYHAFVRRKAVEYIRSHPDEYQAFLGEDFYFYTAGMSQLGTWGDELTLRAICDSFGVVIHVVTSEQQHWYLRYNPLTLKASCEVFLTYIAPIHYNSLRRSKVQRSLPFRLPSMRLG